MSTPTDDTDKESRAPIAYWGGIYSLLVAILYLWGYWSPFGINILEHLSLSDVVKIAAYPIASVFIFLAIGALMGEIMMPEGFMPPGGGAHTRAGIVLRRYAPILLSIYMFSILALFLFGPIEKWRVLPVLIAIPVSLALKNILPLNAIIKSERTHTTLLFLLATLPPFAYGQGAIKANDIISGKNYSLVISKIQSADPKADSSQSTHLRYIGKAGDQYFLYSPAAESVLVIAASESLELKKLKSKAASTPQQPIKSTSKADTPES